MQLMKRGNKKRLKPIFILAALSVIFSTVILLVAVELTFLSIVGLLFFTLATGLGYYLSQKNEGEKNSRFAKALFILAIISNVVGTIALWWLSTVIGA